MNWLMDYLWKLYDLKMYIFLLNDLLTFHNEVRNCMKIL